MNEAVNYIKHLQTRIKVFGSQRDELIKIRSWPSLSASLDPGNISSSSTSSECSTSSRVVVHPCLSGVEILISTGGSVKQGLLSRLLKILLGQGHSVISCATNQFAKRLVYTIQSEVVHDVSHHRKSII